MGSPNWGRIKGIQTSAAESMRRIFYYVLPGKLPIRVGKPAARMVCHVGSEHDRSDIFRSISAFALPFMIGLIHFHPHLCSNQTHPQSFIMFYHVLSCFFRFYHVVPCFIMFLSRFIDDFPIFSHSNDPRSARTR